MKKGPVRFCIFSICSTAIAQDVSAGRHSLFSSHIRQSIPGIIYFGQITFVNFIFIGLLLAAIALFIAARVKSGTMKNETIRLEDKINELSSELKKVQEQLNGARTQLIQSDKMASLGQLTAGIAHEIQNPLNFINNFSELSLEMLEEINDDIPKEEEHSIVNDVKQNLEKVLYHGRRADTIIKGMLQHSRTAPAEKQPTDINKLVEDFFILAYHGMRAKDPGFNCSMEKHLATNLPPVRIIPQDVSRVILNIFNNSFYAVDERSKNEGKNFRPKVSITTMQVNGSIRVSIRDNGKGIKEEIQKKIFNPFFTTKPLGQGTGLGLSISRDIIVRDHNGDIKLDSKPGEYTEFTITLPI
jgi:two-component system NtrC family sensor kinase